MILYDTFEPFRKAYLAEFRGADGLEQYKQLVYQYCVDAVALGLNHNEIVGTLFTDDNSIAMDSLVKYKLPSEVIDFFKEMDIRNVYADAGVPIERDFENGKYKYS